MAGAPEVRSMMISDSEIERLVPDAPAPEVALTVEQRRQLLESQMDQA